MHQANLEELKQAEAKYFDRIADMRTVDGHIPLEAHIRRATKFIPKRTDTIKLPTIDPEMVTILDGHARDKYISWVAHKPGGRVLDGADASRRTIALRISIRFLPMRFAPGHQAVAAGSRPREHARVSDSR